VAVLQALATVAGSQATSLVTVLLVARVARVVDGVEVAEVAAVAVSAISAVKSDILHATACGQLVDMEAVTEAVTTKVDITREEEAALNASLAVALVI
jgi:hypothetical protein